MSKRPPPAEDDECCKDLEAVECEEGNTEQNWSSKAVAMQAERMRMGHIAICPLSANQQQSPPTTDGKHATIRRKETVTEKHAPFPNMYKLSL
jgi:hypothetical protein